MAYLSPEQITGQVLLNMHVDDNDQIVSTSNTAKFDIKANSVFIKNYGKIYSKSASVDTGFCYGNEYDRDKLTRLMKSVHDFTISFWYVSAGNNDFWELFYFFDNYISFCDLHSKDYEQHTIEISTNGNKLINIPVETGKWMHIAAVSNNGTLSFYVDGVRQTSTSTPDYNCDGYRITTSNNGFYEDDTCIILNQALWTDNFTPPNGPLLGDLKYKTILYPKLQRLYQNEDNKIKLY